MNSIFKKRDEDHLHKLVIRVLLLVMVAEGIYLFLEQHWLATFLVTLIVITLFIPHLFKTRLQLEIPSEFHLMTVIFTFAALYLGEIRSFYMRIWWWDIALHLTAGLMMGILGFLLVYILNESNRIDLNMKPGFIAFFAFTFAVTIGTVWEIFEFAMDQIFGLNMQKPMFSDPSGLTDTMWDMIVNAAGALVISLTGWWYLKSNRSFFIKEWIRKFISTNPHWFRHEK